MPSSEFSTFILLKVDLGPTPKKVLETQFYYYYNKENGLFCDFSFYTANYYFIIMHESKLGKKIETELI